MAASLRCTIVVALGASLGRRGPRGPFLPFLEGLRLYGLLDEAQRARLRGGGSLPLNEVPKEVQRAYRRYPRHARGWLEFPDLPAAVIRGVPETLPSGEEGFSPFVEYGFADSPEERDRIFTVPFRVTPQSRDW